MCVILSSGFGEEDISEEFEGKGLAGFIQKPYKPEALVAEVQRGLGARPKAGD